LPKASGGGEKKKKGGRVKGTQKMPCGTRGKKEERPSVGKADGRSKWGKNRRAFKGGGKPQLQGGYNCGTSHHQTGEKTHIVERDEPSEGKRRGGGLFSVSGKRG